MTRGDEIHPDVKVALDCLREHIPGMPGDVECVDRIRSKSRLIQTLHPGRAYRLDELDEPPAALQVESPGGLYMVQEVFPMYRFLGGGVEFAIYARNQEEAIKLMGAERRD